MEVKMVLCQSFLVLSMVVVTYGDGNDRLTKIWSYAGSANPEGSRTAVVNVSSDQVVVQPDSYPSIGQPRSEQPRYSFKPRSFPAKQDQENVYYAKDKYKSEILLPGNLFPIEKVNRNLSEDEEYNPLSGGPFHPKAIPLLRGHSQKRSLDDEITPIQEASRRSLSYILGVEDEDEDESGGDGETEYEIDEEEPSDDDSEKHYKHKHKKPKKVKKLGKYMMPLLLAYKMKYFALVPVMIGGLVLLVGATGLAGFFFALFAAVMGLQKGSY